MALFCIFFWLSPVCFRFPKTDIPSKILFAIGIVSSGGGILFGYDIGIVSGAMHQLQQHFSLSCLEQEVMVSSLLLGALGGSLFGGYLIDRVGRKASIVSASLLFLVGAMILAGAMNYGTLLLGRIILGFAMSLSAASECVYVSEVAPAKIRGSLVSLNEFGITLGILLSYFIGLAFATNPSGWRYMFGLSSIGGLVVCITILFLPRSPRFLLLNGKTVEAKDALTQVRTRSESFRVSLEEEFTSMRNLPVDTSGCFSFQQQCNRKLCFPVFIGIGLVVFQQTTGEPNVLFYASTILSQLGFHSDAAAGLAAVCLGLSKVVATVVCLLFVDRLGRKVFLLIGSMVMAFTILGVAIVSFVNEVQGVYMCSTPNASNVSLAGNITGSPINPGVPEIKWVALMLLMIFIAAYSCSFGPVSWIILSEIFPLNVRGRLFALVTCFNWAVNLAISASFLDFAKSSQGLAGPFVTSCVFCVAATVFIYLVIPETRGKRLEEISALLDKGLISFMRTQCRCSNDEPSMPLIRMEAVS